MLVCGQRRLLFGYNFLFALFALYVLMLGTFMSLVIARFSAQFPTPYIVSHGALLVALGILMMIVAGLGWWGSFFEETPTLCVYASSLLAFAALQLIMVVVDLQHMEWFKSYAAAVIKQQWEDRADQDKFWNHLQRDRHCCGLNGPADWERLPQACCDKHTSKMHRCTMREAHRNGCLEMFAGFLLDIGVWGPISFGLMMLVEVAGATIAMAQVVHVRADRRMWRARAPEWH